MRGALGAAGFALMLAYQGLAENRDMAPSLREQAAAALADGDEIRARRLIEQAADAAIQRRSTGSASTCTPA